MGFFTKKPSETKVEEKQKLVDLSNDDEKILNDLNIVKQKLKTDLSSAKTALDVATQALSKEFIIVQNAEREHTTTKAQKAKSNSILEQKNEELKKKIAINEERYPSDRAKGSAAKYTAYE